VAIFHLHVGTVSRRTGRSSVAAAAYRAGEKIRNERDGITHDYTRKSGVVYSEIMLPENAPEEFQNRAALWNAVEKYTGVVQYRAPGRGCPAPDRFPQTEKYFT